MLIAKLAFEINGTWGNDCPPSFKVKLTTETYSVTSFHNLPHFKTFGKRAKITHLYAILIVSIIIGAPNYAVPREITPITMFILCILFL